MNVSVSYQTLTADNAHLLLTASVFDNPVDATQLEWFVSDSGHELIFAVADNQVVGFASGTVLLHPDKQPAFLINEVDVDPQFQQQGIATCLCEKLIAQAKRKGCIGIWLATEVDNVAARGLYKKLKANETEAVVVYDWGES